MSCTPAPETLAARGIDGIKRLLRDEAPGKWLLNTVLCEYVGVKTNAMVPSLAPWVEAGVIERSQATNRGTQWRMAQPKPRRAAKLKAPVKLFSIPNWPPRFESKWNETVLLGERTTGAR